jgi:hypothetical protein
MNLWDVDHPYYCSDQNFYVGSREQTWGSSMSYDSWAEFLEEMGEADLDLNLIFRWDWEKYTPASYEEDYGEPPEEGQSLSTLKLYYMYQRKGAFKPIEIRHMKDEDEPAVREFLKRRWDHLRVLWAPISEETK